MMELTKTWAELKTLISDKNLSLQYYQSDLEYSVFAFDGNIVYLTSLKSGTSDYTDFETNYKATANKKPAQKFILTDGIRDVGVTADNRIKTDTSISIENNLATQIYGWHAPSQLWQKISAEEYPPGSGQYWIGIFGEVGTRTKAEHPVNISVKKTLATKNLTVFCDISVPTGQTYYIIAVDVADEIASEFDIWEGVQRARSELFSGNGSNKNFTTTYAILDNASYVTVKVGGVTKTYGTDYTITTADDGLTGTVVFAAAPPSGTNNVEVIYDAVVRRGAAFVQESAAYTHRFEAPIKLTAGKFIIGSVSRKSSNAGRAILNLSGFYEVE